MTNQPTTQFAGNANNGASPFNPWGRAPQQQEYRPEAPQYGGSNYISPKLMQYAQDLYRQWNLDESALFKMNYHQIQGEVQRLRKMTPASGAQKEKIKSLINILNRMGKPVEYDVYMIDQLTGGKDGTASAFINSLQAEIDKDEHLVPITDGQINTLVNWYLCPDVPFENFGITRIVKLPEISPRAWRFMEQDEFIDQLYTKMTKVDASEFIGTFKSAVYDWRNTRINDAQFNRIRQLEERMASLYVPKEVTWALVDGEMQMVSKRVDKDWNPNAYTPMLDMQLRQMSFQEASKFIDQLESELNRPTGGSLEASDETSRQQILQDKHSSFNERTGLGVAHDMVMAQQKELDTLNDIIFKLESVCATEFWDLHELTNMDFVLGGGQQIQCIRAWREAMEVAIDMDAINKNGLANMCQDSYIASKIVELVEDLGQFIR